MNYNDAINLHAELKSDSLLWIPTNSVYVNIQSRYEIAILALYKEKYGRKIKDWQKAWRKLNTDFQEDLKSTCKPFEDEVKIEYKKINDERENIENQLRNFAKGFEPEKQDITYCVKVGCSSTYRSQGFGANKYAKESLNEDIKLLELLGFQTEVKAINGGMTGGQFPIYTEDYELWTNILPFDFYLLKMSGKFVSVLNWAVLCWQKGTNPKVYFPFLSQDDYDKSQELAYRTSYKITVENMSQELTWDEIKKLKGEK